MTEIQRVLSSAAWRLWAIAALRCFVVTLSGALVALMLLLIAQRIFGFQLPGQIEIRATVPDWLKMGAAAIGLAAIVAAAWSLIARPRGLRVARELDERADLRETLSTALCYATSKDPWAAEVLRTARDRATKVRVREAIPISGPRFWPVPLALALALYVLFVAVPTFDVLNLFKKRQAAEQQKQEIQRVAAEVQKGDEELKKLLEKAKVQMKDEDAAKDGADKPSPQNPEQLARAQVKKLTSLQEKLAEQKNGEKAKQLEALKQQMRQLKQPGPGPMDNLTKALQKGNFEQAAKELDDLKKQLSSDSLSKEDKDKLQKQAEKMADQLKQLAENKKELEQKLQQAGLNKDQAQKASKSPEDLKKMLDELKNLSEEQKQELMKQAQAMSQACQQCSNMGESMGKMASQMGQMGMSQEGQEAMEKMAGQLSAMAMDQADLDSLDAAMKCTLDQLAKMGGNCKGSCNGEGEGELAAGDCHSPWKAGESQGKFGKGSGGPGISGGGLSPEGTDAPSTTEKKFAASKQTPGPIIGSKVVFGDQVKGESQAEFSAAVESSAKAATEAIETMQVPRELQNAVKGYFGRLETKAKPKTGAASAPADHAEPVKK